MIFLWLAVLALLFGLLGFLLHALYFSKQGLISDLNREIAEMKKGLAFSEKGNSDAQAEIAKGLLIVQSLERQLEQRNEQMNALQLMARRQEDEIRALQETASEIRSEVTMAEEVKTSKPSQPLEPANPTSAGTSASKIPLWKDNLNNILSMLDKIEKEAKK